MDLNGIRGIIKQVRPSWPLPVKYIGAVRTGACSRRTTAGS